MKHIYINNLMSIHEYTPTQKTWHTPTPRNVHFFAYHELGENMHYLSDKTLHLGHESLLFLNKKDAYSVRILEKSTSICIALDFETDQESFALDCRDNLQMKALFKSLLKHKNIDVKNNFSYCMSRLYEVFLLIDQLRAKPVTDSKGECLLEKAYSYMEEHYADAKISNESLACLCGISIRYFITQFERRYGETPKQYILHKKIKEASRLLETRLYNITQISDMMGFADVYSFSKAFKKYMSISPKAYQKTLL